MGYYSEVAFAIPKKDVKGLVDALIESVGDADDLNFMDVYETYFFKFGRTPEERAKIPYVIFHQDWTKWYSSYKDVACIEKYIRSLDSYKFIRVGEENGDVEENESGDVDFDGFHICCSIDGISGHPTAVDDLIEE